MRADNQVQTNGYRIECSEVECPLQKHQDVKEAFVISIDKRSGNKTLVAYVRTN